MDSRTKAKYMFKYNAKIYFNNNNYQKVGLSNAKLSNTDNDDFYNDISKYILKVGSSGSFRSFNIKTSDNFYNEMECNKITDQLLSVSLSGSNYFFLTKKLPIHESEKSQNIKKDKYLTIHLMIKMMNSKTIIIKIIILRILKIIKILKILKTIMMIIRSTSY